MRAARIDRYHVISRRHATMADVIIQRHQEDFTIGASTLRTGISSTGAAGAVTGFGQGETQPLQIRLVTAGEGLPRPRDRRRDAGNRARRYRRHPHRHPWRYPNPLHAKVDCDGRGRGSGSAGRTNPSPWISATSGWTTTTTTITAWSFRLGKNSNWPIRLYINSAPGYINP